MEAQRSQNARQGAHYLGSLCRASKACWEFCSKILDGPKRVILLVKTGILRRQGSLHNSCFT